MDLCLESYEVLPDGRSFARSDEDQRAIGIFENLLATLDAVPPSLIKTAEDQRAVSPRLFDEALELSLRAAAFGLFSASAPEFVEALTKVAVAATSASKGRNQPAEVAGTAR
jgi:hypothetical protein